MVSMQVVKKCTTIWLFSSLVRRGNPSGAQRQSAKALRRCAHINTGTGTGTDTHRHVRQSLSHVRQYFCKGHYHIHTRTHLLNTHTHTYATISSTHTHINLCPHPHTGDRKKHATRITILQSHKNTQKISHDNILARGNRRHSLIDIQRDNTQV